MLEQDDPYRSIYPDWAQAERHAKAINTGKPVGSRDGSHEICRCCNNAIEHTEINLMDSQKSLSHLGFGIPLYFQFIKFCIALTLLLIVSDGIISIYNATTANSLICQNYYKNNPQTKSGSFIQLRGSNSTQPAEFHDKMSNLCNNLMIRIATVTFSNQAAIAIARISSFIIHLIFLIYIKIALYQLGKYYNEVSVNLEDYSVIVKYLPKQGMGKWRFFTDMSNRILNSRYNQQLREEQSLVYDVFVVPWYQDLGKAMVDLEIQKSEALELKEEEPQKAAKELKEYFEAKAKLQQEIEEVKQEENDDKIPSYTVFIIFFNEEDRIYFLKQENKEILRRELVSKYGEENVKNVVIEQAPSPKEIFWSGLRSPQKLKSKFAASVIKSIGFLLLILVVFFLINLLKSHFILAAEADSASTKNNPPQQNSMNSILATSVTWLTFLGIILFNKFVMGEVLFKFTQEEIHETRANFAYSFAFKYALGMFFTTSFMTIIIEGLMYGNYYDQSFGVIQEESMMFIVAAIIIPLMWIINPAQLWHIHKRNKLKGTNKVTQKEANELMADQSYKIGERYAQIVEMMWFCFLYTDLIPAGMFLMLFGMMAFYWVDKYNLLRKSSLKMTYSAMLSDRIAYLIDWTLFWRFSGQCIFEYQLSGKVEIYSFILWFLALLYIVLPIPRIINLHDEDSDFVANDRPIKQVWNKYFKNSNYRSMNQMANLIYGDQVSRQGCTGEPIKIDHPTEHNTKLHRSLSLKKK